MYGFNVCVCIFTICTVRGYTCVYGHIEKKKERRYRVSRDTDGRQWIYVENP